MTDQGSPRVSVLIPVFNGQDSIPSAIGSALAQSEQDLEVIVIDDASSDGTAELVRRLAEDDGRIRLIEAAKNAGPGAARSRGLAAARGRWVAILDADDEMDATRLASLLKIAEADGLDAIADNLKLRDPGFGGLVGTAFPIDPGMRIELGPERFLDNTRPGARVNLGWMQPIVRRQFLETNLIDWPAIRHAEDMVFSMRLLMAGAAFHLIGEAFYVYTQRVGTRSGKASAMSRTVRSAAEQHKALEILEASPLAVRLSPQARRRLSAMRSEISATTLALNLRDALSRKEVGLVAQSALRLVPTLPGFMRCLQARYLIGRRIT